MKQLRLLLSIALFLILCSTLAARREAITPNNKVKARHYLYEAMNQEMAGEYDAAYELYRHAYRIDPSNSQAAANYGIYRLMMDLDTLQSITELNRSLGLMKTRVEEFPGDYYEAEQYAGIANMLDTVEETVRVLNRVDSLYPDRTHNLITLAKAYSSMGNFPAAIAALDSFESREEFSSDIAINRMGIRLAMKDTIGAFADADRVIAKNNGNAFSLTLKGDLYDFIEQPDSALAMYLKAEAVDPNSLRAKYALAETYRNRGDSVNYDKKTYEVLLNEELNMETKVEILAKYLQTLITNKEDTTRGDHLFKVLTNQYPYEAPVLDLSARYNAAKGNPGLAIENIRYAIDQDRTNTSYWGQLITYQLQANKPAEAMRTYHEALQSIEPDMGLDVLYATAAQMDKKYDVVVDIYANMINGIVPNVNINDSIDLNRLRDLSYEELNVISNAFTSIGDALYQKGDTAAGYLAYTNAIAIIPDNALALNNYAYFLALEGKELDKALEMSETALQLNPESSTTMDTYAWVLFLTHNYTKALEYQAAAVELAEKEGIGSADLYAHYGDILFMNGKPDEALKYWKKALESNQDNDLSDKDVKLLQKKISHKTFFYE